MKIIKHDRVRITGEKYNGERGYVTRVHGDQACVVIKGVWDHGIWWDLSELKRTKRYKKEQ
jgi:ribosomal protein L24|tara:strand:- start:1093 stop:1275 length:183 start_codon:yes stop_codon:yes gene_type:complete